MWWILFSLEISGPKAATLLQNTPSQVFCWEFFCKIAHVRKFLMFTVIIKRGTYTEAHLGLCQTFNNKNKIKFFIKDIFSKCD